MDVTCPAGSSAGDIISAEFEGVVYELVVPPGVSEGITFHVSIPEASGAVGSEGSAVMAPDELPEALRKILHALDNCDGLDEFVDDNCILFKDYRKAAWSGTFSMLYNPHRASIQCYLVHLPLTCRKGGEQSLAWTELHCTYVALVEAAVEQELQELRCSAEDVCAHAEATGANGDAHTERLIGRLLGLGRYEWFCSMMSENQAVFEQFGPSRILADSSDSE